MEASFEFFARMMDFLTRQRVEESAGVSAGARSESYRMIDLGFAGRMLNCSVSLGPFRRWARER